MAVANFSGLWSDHLTSPQLFSTNLALGGDRIRPEPNTVIFLGPEASRDIHQGKANVERSDFYLAWAPSKRDCNTMQTIGKAQHAAKRKVLNLSFTEKSIKSTSEFVFKHIDRWHELMVDNDNWSVPFDLSDSVHNLLFDVQGDICFGASFNTKEPGENAFRKMPHMILEIMLLYYPVSKLYLQTSLRLTSYSSYALLCVDCFSG